MVRNPGPRHLSIDGDPRARENGRQQIEIDLSKLLDQHTGGGSGQESANHGRGCRQAKKYCEFKFEVSHSIRACMGEVENMTTQIAALMVTAAIGFRVPAFPQQGAPALEKLKYRQLDVGGSLGLLTATRSDLGGVGPSNCSCDAVTWAGNFDVGRYFTQHLKAEAGFSRTDRRPFSNSNSTYPPTSALPTEQFGSVSESTSKKGIPS